MKMRFLPMMSWLVAISVVSFLTVLGDTHNGEAEDVVAAWTKPYNREEDNDVVNLLKGFDLQYPRQPRGPPQMMYLCFQDGDLITASESYPWNVDESWMCQKQKVQFYDIYYCNRSSTTRSFCNGFDVNTTYFETQGFPGQDCESYGLLTDYIDGDADMEDLKDECLQRDPLELLSNKSTK
eukprot:Nitzschia sp. Nitz4//scaffold78_size91513//13155//13697//NITZ4_004916-RA/size91513-processed-gene-0.163-mRNA-1//-1//CDS//3329558091//6647//frame0